MAYTVNLRRTGRAAAAEFAEQRAWLREQQDQYLDPNSKYWISRREAAYDELAKYPVLVAIWESDLIPQRETHKAFALKAETFLQYRDVIPAFEPVDHRTQAERDLDEWQADTQATRESDRPI